MRTSLILSVVLHIFVLAAVLLNFSSSKPRDIGPQPVTVELVSPSDLTRVKAGKKAAEQQEAANSAPPVEKKPEPAPKAPDPKPVDKVAEKQAVPPPPKAAEPPPKPAEPEVKPEPKKEAAKPEPAPPEPPKREEPPKPKPEKLAEAKPKKPETKPEPKPEPKKEAAKPETKPDQTPFRDRIGDLLKHPAEEQKPQPAPQAATRQNFDADRIAALLNRDPKAGSPATQEGPKEPWRKPSSLQDQAVGMDQPQAPPREALGAPSGQDTHMSTSEWDMFRSQISRCWTPPIGGLGAGDIVVQLRIAMNQDGTLVRAPEVTNSSSSSFFTAAADSAVRAVLQCQPYTMPPDKYKEWRSIKLNFNPKSMYGG